MNQKNKKVAAVWLDNEEALIIANNSGSETSSEFSVQEKVHSKESHGSGSEHSMHKSEQSNNLKYFKSISNLLVSYEDIFLFGPGQSQEQFQNHLNEDTHFKNKKISIGSAQHLTNPQMLAKVREHFSRID